MTGLYNIVSPISQKITSVSLPKSFAWKPLTIRVRASNRSNHLHIPRFSIRRTRGWSKARGRGERPRGGARRSWSERTELDFRHFRLRRYQGNKRRPGSGVAGEGSSGVPSVLVGTTPVPLASLVTGLNLLFQGLKRPKPSAPHATPLGGFVSQKPP